MSDHAKTDFEVQADAVTEQEIIRCDTGYGFLKRKGSVTIVVRQIEKALTERERYAA